MTSPSAASTPAPQTAYAQSDGVSIAYQVFGSGAHDLVVVPGIISHVEERGVHALKGVPGEWRVFRALAG